MEDTFLHKSWRKKLVDTIRRKGIKNEAVLEAIGHIPRHLFVEGFMERYAYEDRALPIAADQTISQPYTVAFQTELLEPEPGQKVLEVGTGSGYQAAVLALLRLKVFSIERQLQLHAKSLQLLPRLGYNVRMFYGDGYMGLPTYGPFQRILITAGAPTIPQALLEQLTIGGILVCPVGEGKTQVMTRVIRKAADDYETTTHGLFAFVPMLKGTNG